MRTATSQVCRCLLCIVIPVWLRTVTRPESTYATPVLWIHLESRLNIKSNSTFLRAGLRYFTGAASFLLAVLQVSHAVDSSVIARLASVCFSQRTQTWLCVQAWLAVRQYHLGWISTTTITPLGITLKTPCLLTNFWNLLRFTASCMLIVACVSHAYHENFCELCIRSSQV